MGPEKLNFYCSEGQRMTYYLFIFYAKFSAVWAIFAQIRTCEIIIIRDFLVAWKTFVCETLNLTYESQIISF